MNVTAKCERADGWWAIHVPEVPGVFTQARRLDQAPAMTADAVATMLDIDPATVHVALEFDAPGVAELKAMQREARNTAERAATAARDLVAELKSEGLTVRDIGVMLDVSPQRVSQLLDA